MGNKVFVGNCKPGKYPDQVDIGLNKEHLDLLMSHLSERGWVNVRLNKGKESGKPYMEIVIPQEKDDGFPKTSRVTSGAATPPPPRRTEELHHEATAQDGPTDDFPF